MLNELEASGTFAAVEPAVVTVGAVRKCWWSRAWIPVAVNAWGDFLCVDLDPLPGGARGQVVTYWHDVARREVIAPDLDAWLEQVAHSMESDVFEVIHGERLRKREGR